MFVRLLAALPLVLVATTASAQNVEITSLALEAGASGAKVHYAISPSSWQRLGGAVTMDLRIRDASGNTTIEFESPLSAASGAATFALPKNAASSELEVWLVHGGQVQPMQLGPVVSRRVTLVAQAEGSVAATAAPSKDWGKEPTVIAACNKTFSSSTNRAACLDVVASAGSDPTARIQWCADDMESDSSELTCLQHVGGLAFDPLAAMEACDKAMEGDTKELTCLSFVALATEDPAAIVSTCDASSSGDTAELACVEAALSR
jgi:hypothetical protein